MKSDTHKIEKATTQAAHAYTVQRLEQRIKELEGINKQLKTALSEALKERNEERKVKHVYAAELRKLTNMMPDGDVDD